MMNCGIDTCFEVGILERIEKGLIKFGMVKIVLRIFATVKGDTLRNEFGF